jgi:methanethiol S-methyltransferase
MQRISFFIYGLFCHALFLGVYGWMAAFFGNFDFGFLPTIDGPAGGDVATAITIDVALVAAFALQHSIMARPGFKRWWTRYVPEPIERSTYVLVSCLAMVLLLSFWRPIGGLVWDVQHPGARTFLHGLFAFGWLAVPAASVLIDHFDLFGTRQVWLHLRGRPYTPHPFRTPLAYRWVRHPLYIGWMIAFWATPTMTVSHLVLSILLSAYILVAIPFEERDLIRTFGEKYSRYRERVGALLPRLARPTAR